MWITNTEPCSTHQCLLRRANLSGRLTLDVFLAWELAERQFGFSKKESELAAQRAQEAEQRIRQDERAKITQQVFRRRDRKIESYGIKWQL